MARGQIGVILSDPLTTSVGRTLAPDAVALADYGKFLGKIRKVDVCGSVLHAGIDGVKG